MAAPLPVAIDALLAAVSEPSDEVVDALRPHLAPDVEGRGLFLAGTGMDAFTEAVLTPATPVLAFAEFEPPAYTDEAVTITGTLPPGLPLERVILTVEGDESGRISVVLQEIVEAKSAPESGIDLDEDIAEFVNSAFERQAPFVVAYVDSEGAPHVSFRGTVQVHGSDSLALWLRDPTGGLAQAIENNPRLALIGSDQTTRAHYVFEGRARISDDPEEAAEVFEKSPDHERNVDAGRRGVAVVIDLDLVKGGMLGAMTHQVRV